MILTVNIGNTHITIGGYEKDSLKFCGRLHSDIACTADEYAIRLVNLLSLYHVSPAQIEGGILGSVVPALTGQVLAGLSLEGGFGSGLILIGGLGPGAEDSSGATFRGLFSALCCNAGRGMDFTSGVGSGFGGVGFGLGFG